MEAVRDAEKQDNSGGQQMDPFASFFGGNQQQQGRQAKKGKDARVELSVSLEDMYVCQLLISLKFFFFILHRPGDENLILVILKNIK